MYDLASAGAGIIDCSCNRYSFLFLLGWGGEGQFGLDVTPLPAPHSRKNDPPSSSGVSADQSKLVTAAHH